ncbi:uncharacterized protein LOC112143031 [Oryzias melastigma]|uniref:uncharacterized protein LOC112143031 n=1 Tax=Oryzias melastigma TaxID=30732 RepID=UPI000CF81F3B|nr:uncharacterized protein LOC112143031 [Oryzias melastigma]
MLYNNIYSSVSLNPGVTPQFKVNRGIRQGCPISPKLFILATQLLTLLMEHRQDIQGIRIFDKEFKISQFADDTALFLKNSTMIGKALHTIQFFSKASGLTLNIKKYEILPINSCQYQVIESIRVVNEVKYLGVLISKDLSKREEINITKKLTDMKRNLSRWLTRDLTIFGRNLLTKTEGVSKIIYPCHSMHISPQNIKKANSIIYQFLWKNKTHYIKRSQLVKSYKNGGINTLDFEAMVGTFKIKWLKAFLLQQNSIWFHIPKNIFSQIGGISFLLKCDFEITKLPIALSNFHKQTLLFWKMFYTHNFTPHGSTLWNNRTILVNRKSVFKQDWFNQNIVFVKDLMDSEGNLLTKQALEDKFNFSCSPKDYKNVCHAIPVALIQLIRNIFLHSQNVTASMPTLRICGCDFVDFKCNNKFIKTTIIQKIYYDYNQASFRTFIDITSQSVVVKGKSKFVMWPILPKVKECHFKVINNIYPVAEFLKKRFNFDVEPCVFCNSCDETLQHLFFSCQYSKEFWTNIRSWINLKLDIPHFSISDVLIYMENLDISLVNLINIIILLGKYHIHCCKWRGNKPSFSCFLNEFKLYFKSLKCIKKL